MSGGSWDYAYMRAEDMANGLCQKGHSSLRRAFGLHLKKVAKAMHDIEWVDSGDYGEGEECQAIESVLGDTANKARMEVLIEDARDVITEMKSFGA